MKHLLCVIFVLALAGSVMAQPPGQRGKPAGGGGQNKPSSNKPAAGKPAGGGGQSKPSSSKPAAGKPASNFGQSKPSSSKPAAGKPASNFGQSKPSSSKPAAGKPASSFGQNKPSSNFGQNKPSSSFGQNKPSSSFGQNKPPSSFGQNKPPSSFGQNKPPGGFGQKPPNSGGKYDNAINAINLVGKIIENTNQRPPGPGPRPRPPYGYDDRPRPPVYAPRPPVYVPSQTQQVIYTTSTPVTPVQVQTGTTSTSSTTVDQRPLTLTRNTTTIAAPPAKKDVVAKAQSALKKEISTSTAKLVDSLKEEVMPEEKVDAIMQKLIEEGKDKMKVASFASAIEEGETENATKLITELMTDPLEGMKITKEINLAKKLSELGESLQGDDFEAGDLNKLKKLVDKSNLSSKIKKNTKKTIEALNVNLQILETLSTFKESSLPATISAPTGEVTVITVPKLGQGAIYALDSGTYIVDGEAFATGEENISAAFPQIQVYSNPVAQSSQRTNQINLSNTTGRSASYYLEDRTTRTLNSGNVATFDVPDSGTINVRSQGRWKAFTVGSGNYSLEYDNGTWSVAAKSITVTLDNSANPVPFHCFVDRTEYTINPGEQMAFTSSIGILDIQFARGEDTGNGTNYIFEESTTLKVGLDQRDNKWALFQ